ncbi:MAG: hypothetical protein QF878_16270, partial [SAR202 cluster bacterium]|nr:hypothetical protein [SAR202 cluster bacterium]
MKSMKTDLKHPELTERWATATPIRRFQAPKLADTFAPIVCVCRAVLMQPDEPKATGEYEAALNAIGETDIGHTVKTVIKPRSFSSREQYILKIWKPPLLNSLADVVLPHSLELSKHWTTSNLLCGLMFGVMLTLDTIGIDWQQ